MDYKHAGVDIEAGYASVKLMKQFVQRTMRPEVLSDIGGFSGAFSMKRFKDMEEPALVSGTDGVGTKLKLAFLMDKHDTIGIDCVAMCVNDIACAGGEPLFFLDYIACGKNYPEKIATIVSGVAEGCVQSGAALIGGETAEMPGFYPEDEYDLAGFAVGIVDKKDLITGKDLKAGDVLIGIASSGVHSNGFSLVRKIFDMTKESLDTYYDCLGKTLGETLLEPTKIYVKALAALKEGRSAPDLDKRDRDIDRLDWLIARQNHIFQSRPALYRKIGISPEEMTDFYIVSRIIERIGDHVVSMNGYLANVNDPNALSAIAGIVEDMGLASLFLESMDTLMGKDAVAANDCIGRCRTALEGIVKLHSVGTGLAADSAVAVSMLSSNVKRIIEYSIDIAEIAINSAMD